MGFLHSALSYLLTQSTLFSAVPQSDAFLDTQPLAKGKTEKTKKKKEAANKSSFKHHEDGFMTLPAPGLLQSYGIGHEASPGPSSGVGTGPSGSPAPKAGFSRISSTAVVEAPSQASTPPVGGGGSERTKVAFGFGTKRKAGEDAEAAPASKRR